jgi:DNA-binding response OmpR family regulator
MDGRRKLLLVDDDAAVLEYLTLKLAGEFDVTSCADAEAAIAIARERSPDIIVCDIELPEMDGGDLSAALFALVETRDIPFVYLTGLLTPAELDARGNQLAGRVAVSKQSPIREIVARIRAQLAG